MSRIQKEKLRLIQESNRRLLNEQSRNTDAVKSTATDGNSFDLLPTGRPGEGDYNEMTTPIYPDSENALEAIQELLEVVGNMNKGEIVDDLTGIVSRFTEFGRYLDKRDSYSGSAPKHGENLYKGQ